MSLTRGHVLTQGHASRRAMPHAGRCKTRIRALLDSHWGLNYRIWVVAYELEVIETAFVAMDVEYGSIAHELAQSDCGKDGYHHLSTQSHLALSRIP